MIREEYNDRGCSPRSRQQTLKSEINCSGTGLHSGVQVSLTLRPAPPNTGIVFRRVDISDSADIPALWTSVVDSQLCTAIGDGNGVRIGTVEHLMAALYGCGVDNVFVELDGPEVPIMDGSSAPFVFLIECAGVIAQKSPLKVIEILKHVSVGDTGKIASLTPSPRFSIGFEIEFSDTLIDHQEYYFELDHRSFGEEVARARTFGFDHEYAALRSKGLARGGSLDNAIVVSGYRVLNDGGLRYEDEFVRHKVLDCVGDLYLAGAPMMGHFHGLRSGHSLTHALLGELLSDSSAWRYKVMEDETAPVEEPGWLPEAAMVTA